MAAGNYPNRVQLLNRLTSTNELGEVEEVFTPAHHMWCRIEEDSPRMSSEAGGPQSGIDGTISIRGYVDIDPTDMVRDSAGRTWHIEGRTRGVGETILRVYMNDELRDWKEEA